MVTKKDGLIRYSIHYRQLNSITSKDSYPQDCLESLHEAMWFSTLDLKSGYWQIEMDPKDHERTAFCSMSGFFEFQVMPFGLSNAHSRFQVVLKYPF